MCVAGILTRPVQVALRHVANWHKYAIQLEFSDDDIEQMQSEAQRLAWLHVLIHVACTGY